MRTNKLIFLFLMLGILPACVNSRSASRSTSSSSSTTSDTTDDTGSETEFKISTVTIAEASSSDDTLTTTIYFDSEDMEDSLTSFCAVDSDSSDKTCVCQFSWSETNETSGTAVSIPRIFETSVSTSQSFLISCEAPSVYSTEIEDGTVINVKVVGKGSGNSDLSMDAYPYTKGDTETDADFRDAEGNAFINIHRYSCYEKVKKGQEIKNRTITVTNSDTGEAVDVYLATSFCVSGSSSGDGCDNLADETYSAQSYYYSLFISSTDKGGVNSENTRYVCPKVKEALDSDETVGTEDDYYPMDATFALAKSANGDFVMGVEAPSVLGVGDSSSAPTSCATSDDGTSSSSSSSTSAISNKCLGFALKPNSNGSCPSFIDGDGSIRMTYRLRRYIALYPVSYEASGAPIEQAHGVDIVYILDRPVDSGDPLEPYSMLGPKPCPFAYLDHSGTLDVDIEDPDDSTMGYGGGRPIYAAINNSKWDGINVDGIHFPNEDVYSDDGVSCSAIIPFIEYTSSGNPKYLFLATTHSSNSSTAAIDNRTINLQKIYVRPMKPWAPHYEEDTNFNACAPLADPFQDPPLHFSKIDDTRNQFTGNVAWCAEVYPSQIDAVEEIDHIYNAEPDDAIPGYFIPYTSHVVKKSSSADCIFTEPEIPDDADNPYPSSGGGTCGTSTTNFPGRSGEYGPKVDRTYTVAAARHPEALIVDYSSLTDEICAPKTCDRTATNPGDGNWTGFPLLAPPADVESMLALDPSYGCLVSFDEDRGKKDKKSPKGGCCTSGVLDFTTGTPVDTYDDAHLEPDRKCGTPEY